MRQPRRARRRILVAMLLASGSGARLAAAIEVSVTVVAESPEGAPAEITLIAEPAEVGPAAAGAPVESPAGPGRWMLDLPAGRSWRLRAEAPGYWGETVEAGRSRGGPVELRLWPAGVLRGTLSVTGGGLLPTELELRFEPDPFSRQAGKPPAASVRCPVRENEWRCELPAGRLNLVVAAERWVPVRLWEVTVEPGAVRNLGSLVLEPGGVVFGRVLVEEGSAPSAECVVRAEPASGEDTGRGGLDGSPVEEDGSFELAALAAGEYVVTASQPDYLPASSPPLPVAPGVPVELSEPLLLRRPAALELVFTPPVGPGDQSWRFEIRPLDAEGRPSGQALRGESGPDGIWVQEDLVPGLYEVVLTATPGVRLPPQRIELPSGRTTQPVDLPVLLVEGSLLSGGEPLAGTVVLTQPEERLSARFQADETGNFSGLLTREGRWEVRVEAPREGISVHVEPVEVRAEGGGGVAFLEIYLPGTVLEGEVTDLWGNPVVGANVMVQRRDRVAGSRGAKTDAQGLFRIRGLEPGSISVMAQSGNQRSQWFHLVLEEGRPVQPLQLVLR